LVVICTFERSKLKIKKKLQSEKTTEN